MIRSREGLPLILAHRGVVKTAAENTLSAFLAAIEDGADGIETDVRMTSDGELIMCHEETLGGLVVSETSFERLRQVVLIGDQHVPSLEETMSAMSGSFVDLEIKGPSDPSICDLIAEKTMGSDGSLVVTSFWLPLLERLKGMLGSIPIGVLSAHSYDQDGGVALRAAIDSGYQIVLPENPSVDADLIDRCHEAGLQIFTWTVDDPKRAVELTTWGIDGLITNSPRTLLDAIRVV